MRILISPAKKMNVNTDTLPPKQLPLFLEKTEQLLAVLKSMPYDALKALWACNDSIAALNFERLRHMDLTASLTPAIFSYEGIQYQSMGAGVFTGPQYGYIEEHLRILSGFYGMLRPFDGITPYRLEMQAKLSVSGCRDLYAFWGDSLAKALENETDTLINLASAEYSKAVKKHLSPRTRVINCIFGEWNGKKVVEKGTLCKMARGAMVRFLTENRMTHPEDMKEFALLQFRFCKQYSTDTNYYFLKEDNDHA